MEAIMFKLNAGSTGRMLRVVAGIILPALFVFYPGAW
jgi:hypothetical protein